MQDDDSSISTESTDSQPINDFLQILGSNNVHVSYLDPVKGGHVVPPPPPPPPPLGPVVPPPPLGPVVPGGGGPVVPVGGGSVVLPPLVHLPGGGGGRGRGAMARIPDFSAKHDFGLYKLFNKQQQQQQQYFLDNLFKDQKEAIIPPLHPIHPPIEQHKEGGGAPVVAQILQPIVAPPQPIVAPPPPPVVPQPIVEPLQHVQHDPELEHEFEDEIKKCLKKMSDTINASIQNIENQKEKIGQFIEKIYDEIGSIKRKAKYRPLNDELKHSITTKKITNRFIIIIVNLLDKCKNIEEIEIIRKLISELGLIYYLSEDDIGKQIIRYKKQKMHAKQNSQMALKHSLIAEYIRKIEDIKSKTERELEKRIEDNDISKLNQSYKKFKESLYSILSERPLPIQVRQYHAAVISEISQIFLNLPNIIQRNKKRQQLHSDQLTRMNTEIKDILNDMIIYFKIFNLESVDLSQISFFYDEFKDKLLFILSNKRISIEIQEIIINTIIQIIDKIIKTNIKSIIEDASTRLRILRILELIKLDEIKCEDMREYYDKKKNNIIIEAIYDDLIEKLTDDLINLSEEELKSKIETEITSYFNIIKQFFSDLFTNRQNYRDLFNSIDKFKTTILYLSEIISNSFDIQNIIEFYNTIITRIKLIYNIVDENKFPKDLKKLINKLREILIHKIPPISNLKKFNQIVQHLYTKRHQLQNGVIKQQTQEIPQNIQRIINRIRTDYEQKINREKQQREATIFKSFKSLKQQDYVELLRTDTFKSKFEEFKSNILILNKVSYIELLPEETKTKFNRTLVNYIMILAHNFKEFARQERSKIKEGIFTRTNRTEIESNIRNILERLVEFSNEHRRNLSSIDDRKKISDKLRDQKLIT